MNKKKNDDKTIRLDMPESVFQASYLAISKYSEDEALKPLITIFEDKLVSMQLRNFYTYALNANNNTDRAFYWKKYCHLHGDPLTRPYPPEWNTLKA
jgi:hypothetical protein